MLFLLTLVAAMVAGPSAIEPPDRNDVDMARVERAHEETGLGGMAHCNRIESLRCQGSTQDPAEFRCTYREWTEDGPWPRRTVVLRKEAHAWRWVSGDAPKCSILLID